MTVIVECLKEIKILSIILLYQAEKLLCSLPSICILSLEQCCEGFLSSVSHNKYNLLLLISYILFAQLPYPSILSAKILPSHGDLLPTHTFYLYFSSFPTYTLKHTLNSLASLSLSPLHGKFGVFDGPNALLSELTPNQPNIAGEKSQNYAEMMSL